ncbi:MAG: hypothetical protein IT361_11255 [Gemmatimonadaceae bacterium]|nr:hypothetical protein [Gemmatimonadaceae bacterium]
MSPVRRSRLPLAFLAALLVACGGDGTTTPTPTPAGFTVSLSSTTLSVEQGASGSITATIGRTGSFAGTVNLAVSGLPTGVTATFNPSAIAVGTTSTTLAVGVAATVAPGNYPFTVSGSATGVAGQSATFTLTVTAKPAIALTLSGATGSAQQSTNATVTATIARTNFAGAVTVAVTGAPTGITPSVSSAGDVYTVTLAVSPIMTPGAYPLTIAASGTGVTTVSAAYTLTVTAAPAASIALTATPASITMQAGGAAQASTLTITRTNFTGSVVTAVQSGLPSGVTATFTPQGPTTTNSVTVSFQSQVNTTPGTYNVVIQGAGAGATAGTVTIALTITAAPASSISLAASPASLIATAGGNSATTTITITRNNFTGQVTIAPNTGGIGGISSATTPSATTGNTATITFTAAAGTTPGTYPVTITGSGTGIANATTTVQLQVVALASSIGLSLSPSTVSIQQGGSSASVATITRTNFTGTVTLAATGQPAGITVTNSGPTSGNTVNLNVGVASGVAPGAYPVTVTASGSGVTSATATLTVSVSQATTGGNASWQFCNLVGIPVWFAVQDGDADAPWTRVSAGPNNVFTFSIATAGAVAYVTQSGGASQLNVVYGTRAELNAQSTNGACVGSGTGKTITGTVAGLSGALDLASVQLGAAAASVQSTSPNFTLNNVQDGNRDLVATRSTINITTGGLNVNKAIIRRDLNLANNSSLGTLDFGGSEAFDPVTRQVTIAGAAGGEMLQAFNYFFTTNGTFALLGLGGLTGNTYNVPTVPTNKSLAGDVNVLVAMGTTTGGGATSIRAIWNAFRDPANQTLTLGPQLNTPAVSVVSTSGYARIRTNTARQTEYNNAWNAFFGQPNRSVSMVVQPGYMAFQSAFDVTIPDFSGVTGWQNTWGPQAGISTTWGVAMTGFINLTGLYVEGSSFRTAQRQGSITP